MVSDQLWQVWSDTVGWAYLDPTSTEYRANMLARISNVEHLFGATDWRAVQIPNPRQFEAAPDLLAALKGILESTESEAIGEYESVAAYAAIAKAEGRGSDG